MMLSMSIYDCTNATETAPTLDTQHENPDFGTPSAPVGPNLFNERFVQVAMPGPAKVAVVSWRFDRIN
jgi:hypothetical protein